MSIKISPQQAIFSACGNFQEHDLEILKILLSINCVDEVVINSPIEEQNGETALHRASEAGILDAVKLLLEHGANVNATDNYGNTPLHFACGCGWTNIVALLLDHNPDLNLIDDYGNTALDCAKRNNWNDVVALFEKL